MTTTENLELDTISASAAAVTVALLYSDTLSISADDITAERADKIINKTGVHTTTELLLLLARFHADLEDQAGSELLAEFAVRFAQLECQAI